MNTPFEQAGRVTCDHETLVQPATHPIDRTPCSCLGQESAERACPLAGESPALLGLRPGAVAFILWVGFGLSLVWHVADVLRGKPLDLLFLGAHALAVLVVGRHALRRPAFASPRLGP